MKRPQRAVLARVASMLCILVVVDHADAQASPAAGRAQSRADTARSGASAVVSGRTPAPGDLASAAVNAALAGQPKRKPPVRSRADKSVTADDERAAASRVAAPTMPAVRRKGSKR